MKIKTICEKTGLTDRAIRFYIEEGLLSPACTENYLGRKSYDFQPQDVRTLQDIAVLRQFGFSVSQIKAIQHTPEESRFVVESMRQQKWDIVNEEQQILTVLNQLGDRENYSVSTLASALREQAAKHPIPQEEQAERSKLSMHILAMLTLLGYGLGALAVIAALFLLTDMIIVYMGQGGFDFTPAGMQTMLGRIMPYIIEVFVFTGLAVMVLYFLNILRKYAGNDKKPEITVRAAVVDKKMNADSVILSSFFHRDGGMITFLVFRTDDGKTLQLTVPRDTYYNVNIGSRGQLTYQGTKMVKFTPK